MSASGRNSGFHLLDDFVCQAIHPQGASLANPAKPGRNEGMAVVEELLFDTGLQTNSNSVFTDQGLRAEVSRLAEALSCYISASDDPVSTVANARKLLLAELEAIQQSAISAYGQRNGSKRLAGFSEDKPA